MALANAKADQTAVLTSRHVTPSPQGAWSKAARKAALARVQQMGAPNRRDEYWKFTDPTGLTAAQSNEAAPLRTEESQVFSDVDCLTITFVDGIYAPDRSDDLSEEGLTLEVLSDAMDSDIHWVESVYGVLENRGQDPVARPLAALNTAVASQGLVLHVTGKVKRPVAFYYVHENATSDAVIHHVVKLEAGASVSVLESGPGAARLNTCLEVDIADSAAFNHVRTQGRDFDRYAATHMFARLGTESSFKSFTMTANGRLTRNECVLELLGNDAKAHVAGACIGDGVFHHDDTVFVTHDAENCESRQVFKKVLRNGAVGAFQGKILVKAGAQKTDGYQISKALMLDDDSEFLAKPELEIYADDVACSHGSTVGEVDEATMFYLTSRGIPHNEAQDMMVHAFLDESIQEIEDAALADIIRARLGEWLSRRHQA